MFHNRQAHLFGISEECYIRVTEHIIESILEIMPNIIKWPAKEDYPYISQQFNEIRK